MATLAQIRQLIENSPEQHLSYPVASEELKEPSLPNHGASRPAVQSYSSEPIVHAFGDSAGQAQSVEPSSERERGAASDELKDSSVDSSAELVIDRRGRQKAKVTMKKIGKNKGYRKLFCINPRTGKLNQLL